MCRKGLGAVMAEVSSPASLDSHWSWGPEVCHRICHRVCPVHSLVWDDPTSTELHMLHMYM